MSMSPINTSIIKLFFALSINGDIPIMVLGVRAVKWYYLARFKVKYTIFVRFLKKIDF